MATYAVTVAGNTKNFRISTLTIQEAANNRGTLSAELLSLDATYRPNLNDDVIVTEDSNRIFGGVIDTAQEYGLAGVAGTATSTKAISTKISAVDYNSYADRKFYTGNIASGTLKAALTTLVTVLSPYGVTLDGAQATGPTLAALSYNYRKMTDVFNDLSALSGYTWQIDYSKVLRMTLPGSTAAPFNVADGDNTILGDITSQPTRSNYANHVILLAGTGTKVVTDNFTGDGTTTTFTLNYTLQTSYGYVTNGGVNETLGTGATWSYNASTNQITRTSAPANLNAISINYTAQFPLVVEVDGGASSANRVDEVIAAPTVFDKTVATALANAYLTRDNVTPYELKYVTTRTGAIHVGQTQTVALTSRNISSGTYILTGMQVQEQGGRVLRTITVTQGTAVPKTWQATLGSAFSGSSAAAGATVNIVNSSGVGGSGTTNDIAIWTAPTTLGSTHLVGANHGGTNLDTSASSGIPSVNAGTWTVNNVLTTNQVLIAAASNTVTSTSSLTFSGTTLTVNNTIVTPASTNLTLAPTSNLVTNTSNMLPNTGYTTKIGALTNKYLALYAGELWVETLVAQSTIATIGGRILVCPTNLLTQDAAAAATTLHFKYNNLANGDRIYFEANGNVEFMAVTSGASGVAGNYTYTVTRDLAGVGASNWSSGDACADTGQAGNGFLDIYSVRGVKASTEIGPTVVGNVRNSSTYNDWSPRWAIGNLNGLYGYNADTYGVAVGDSTAANITVDATNGIRFRTSTTVLGSITAGTFTFGTGAHGLTWDGTSLSVTGILILNTATSFGSTVFDLGVNLQQVATTFIYPGATTGSGFNTNSYWASLGAAGANGLYTNAAVEISGVLTMDSVPKFAGTNSTGTTGVNFANANSPSVGTQPYTWIKVTTSDGSSAYIPAFK